MSTGEKRPLAEAKVIAKEFYELIEGYSPEILIAGSIRRQKSLVGDIEIVARHDDRLLQRLDALVAEGTIAKALYGGNNSTRWGEAFRGCMFRGMKVEIFTFDELNRGSTLLIRTGPGDANTRIMIMLDNKKAPYRFKDGYVWHSKHWERNTKGEWDADDKRLIPAKTEEMLFNLLGLGYVQPEERSEERYVRMFSRESHLWGPCPHVCEIQTGRVWTEEVGLIDTTVKSASTDEGRILAPTWDMVNGHKSGEITWEEYTTQYTDLLRGRYRSHPDLFMSILKRDRVVIGCYCNAGEPCHRHLAVDILKKIATAKGILVVDAGEIQPAAKQLQLF